MSNRYSVGIVIDVKPEHSRNALEPTVLTATPPNVLGSINGPECAFGVKPVIEPAAV